MKNKLKVGVGKTEYKIPLEVLPVENFKSIHDQLYTRIIYIESQEKAVFVSLEMTSIRDYELALIKQTVSEILNVSIDHVWVCVTHTFSVPHIRNKTSLHTEEEHEKNNKLCTALLNSVERASYQALNCIQDAKIGFGNNYCSVNVNRDMYTLKGWWLGSNDLGVSDKLVSIVSFYNMQDKPIAILYSYDVQSSVMNGSLQDDGSRIITGDLAGRASHYIESQLEETVAMFIVGAAGDQAPAYQAEYTEINPQGEFIKTDIQELGFVLVDKLGSKLGYHVVTAMNRIHSQETFDSLCIQKTIFDCPGQMIPKVTKDILPTKEYKYIKDEKREVEVEIMKIGSIVFVGCKPELSSITAMDIKKASPFLQTMVFTMVNGGAKYMPDETSYDRITYEAMNSMYAQGSAEILVENTIKLLNQLSEENE